MTIVVLAWGSLVWDRRDLAIAGAFRPVGPPLPIEFSRVSNDGRLTLIIDDSVGAKCVTYVAQSIFDDLNSALVNLWAREGRKDEKPPRDIRRHGRVGFVDRVSGEKSVKAMERHPRSVETIDAWAAANVFDGVIWTALAGNFQEKVGAPFSVGEAIRYLEALDEDTRAKALQYVRNAPPEVQTPVRAALNAQWPERSAVTAPQRT